ncbi:MAG: GNAT family protein, partial [Woeseiaceae bacterium]|nr:GNAT family protein [Woeseiaceae bacterium]
HAPAYQDGSGAVFAIVRREDEQLVGAISLKIDAEFDKAELGYWVGTPFWNSGYATEAATAMLDYGFRDRKLNRIAAKHLARNPASGRVMQKAGMQLEGTARQDTKKWGRYEDLVSYGILREEWLRR